MNFAPVGMAALLIFCVLPGAVADDAPSKPRVLLLTKSSGFEHGVIKNDASGTSHVERIMTPIVEKMGGAITCTKDASMINKASLENYDVVIFYTSGVLTEAGEDGNPPMTAEGPAALFDWIRGGGGFIGFHSATDSFRSGGDTPTPYIEMLGGEFVTHGAQFEGTIRNVSPAHPAIASLPETWSLRDEWYLFRHLNKDAMHVLALLEIGDKGRRQRMYDIPDYPMIWCRAFGEGRVLYNGMGHREDVWEHPAFQAIVEEHIRWASGEGALNADPNYSAVVPE
ncbi:MAG TPA: ThuA domain-containing protein [Candidatus Hydrogenedentes bacterium]|nr:ThuA domain-containing protein [Candidatus Hydrogenedentota bacterium]